MKLPAPGVVVQKCRGAERWSGAEAPQWCAEAVSAVRTCGMSDIQIRCVGSMETNRFFTRRFPAFGTGIASTHSSRSVSLICPTGRERRRHARCVAILAEERGEQLHKGDGVCTRPRAGPSGATYYGRATHARTPHARARPRRRGAEAAVQRMLHLGAPACGGPAPTSVSGELRTSPWSRRAPPPPRPQTTVTAPL